MKDFSFLDELVKHFEKLPGVGKKTALRYAYYVVEKMSIDGVNEFAKDLVTIKENVKRCNVCGMLTDKDTCDICLDSSRNKSKIIVVKDTKDVFALEKIKQYNGLYHVLNGLISPLDGIGPESVNIDSLESRCKNDSVKEVILATPFTPNGETTALFLERILDREDLVISRIGYGLPAGGDIEYTDELTLLRSLQNRQILK